MTNRIFIQTIIDKSNNIAAFSNMRVVFSAKKKQVGILYSFFIFLMRIVILHTLQFY